MGVFDAINNRIWAKPAAGMNAQANNIAGLAGPGQQMQFPWNCNEPIAGGIAQVTYHKASNGYAASVDFRSVNVERVLVVAETLEELQRQVLAALVAEKLK